LKSFYSHYDATPNYELFYDELLINDLICIFIYLNLCSEINNYYWPNIIYF